MRFNILNRLGVNHVTDGQTDRTFVSNSAVYRTALKTGVLKFVAYELSYAVSLRCHHGVTLLRRLAKINLPNKNK